MISKGVSKRPALQINFICQKHLKILSISLDHELQNQATNMYSIRNSGRYINICKLQLPLSSKSLVCYTKSKGAHYAQKICQQPKQSQSKRSISQTTESIKIYHCMSFTLGLQPCTVPSNHYLAGKTIITDISGKHVLYIKREKHLTKHLTLATSGIY